MEDARSARIGPRRGESSADLDWAGLVRYYAAAAAKENASATGFRLHREEQGSRFVFYAGVDPLFGTRRIDGQELGASPGQPGSGQLGYWEPDALLGQLDRTARLGAERLFYGYPLVVTDPDAAGAGEILPVLFAAWPVASGDVQVNPALLPVDPDQRRMVWRKLKALQRTLAEGGEPAPERAQAFGAALTQLVETLGLRTVEDRAILFRGRSPRLPLWLWEEWQHLLERPAALGGVLGDALAEKPDSDGEQSAGGEDRPAARLFVSALSPADRQRLEQALSIAGSRAGWGHVDVPAGDQLIETAFHLILNGWHAGMRVLVLVPGDAEARQIRDRFAATVSLPMVAVWGRAAERQRTFADLQWVLRRRRHRVRPPDDALVGAVEARLESAWCELQRREEMVAKAGEAGESLAALGKEMEQVAAGIPSSLLMLVEREARRTIPGQGSDRFGSLAKALEGSLLEAERVAASRWHWLERLWPWQRRRRALARLELQVRSLLHGAGFNSGDWFAAPLPGDAGGMLKSLHLLRTALSYADLLERYQQVKLQAGAGAWDAPEGLPGRLAASWEELIESAGAAARARREQELASLPEPVVDQLELLLALQGELAVAAPGSPAEQELQRAVDESFAAAVQALPVWIVPLADAGEVLPERPALFDLLVVVGAERIPLAAVLPFAVRATSVLLVGDARREAEALGEWLYEDGHPGWRSERQELAAAHGLAGLDYVLHGWPVTGLRWLRQMQVGPSTADTAGADADRTGARRAGADRTGADQYLCHRAFPLGQLLNYLYLAGSLLPAGPPVNGFATRTGSAALRWVVTRGEMGAPASGSAFNLDEAETVVRLLDEWLGSLKRQAEVSQPVSIAVVTPFGRQRELLLQKLAALLPKGYEELAEISVLQVAELVGRRFDVVLVSTVLSEDAPAAHQAYLARHSEFAYALLAAARMSLTVVGNPTAMSALGGVWSELVNALVAAHAEDLPAPDSFTARGPYPPGSQGIALAYQELYLMQNGWHGQRAIGTTANHLRA